MHACSDILEELWQMILIVNTVHVSFLHSGDNQSNVFPVIVDVILFVVLFLFLTFTFFR